jgi:hypothetical protein
MTPSLLQSIREKALAAGGAAWTQSSLAIHEGRETVCHTGLGLRPPHQSERSLDLAAFIACANPETVLAILAYITQLEGEAEAGRKAVEALRGGLNVACEEIYDLRRYANNHGGMIDCEKFTEGLAALAALPPSQGGDAG